MKHLRKTRRARSQRVRRKGGDYAADRAAWVQQMELNHADSESVMDMGQKLAWENGNRMQRKLGKQKQPGEAF